MQPDPKDATPKSPAPLGAHNGPVKIVVPGPHERARTAQAEMALVLTSLPDPREAGHDLPWSRHHFAGTRAS